MNISIPNTFFVPVYYDEKNTLNIEKRLNSYTCFIKRENVVIGISLPVGGGEIRWPKDREALKKYADEKNVTLKFAPNANTADEQYSQVENLIAQGINVLILSPVDLKAAAAIVDMAHKAGIKVLAYDRLIENSDLDLFVSYNNVNIGELQGRYLVQKVPKGNYIILSGGPTDNNSKLVKEGAMEFIKPLAAIKDIKIVTEEAVDNWNPKIAYEIVKNSLIANNNKVDAILSPNDAIAGAVVQALTEQGLAGKVPVTGQDAELPALKRIVEGTQSMTVFSDIRTEAKTAIDVAIKLAKGENILTTDMVNNGKKDVPSILITPVLIDKNNINTVLIKNGYLSPNDVYEIYN